MSGVPVAEDTSRAPVMTRKPFGGGIVLAREDMRAHDAGDGIADRRSHAREAELHSLRDSSSGCEAPRRNEKFVVTAKLAYRMLTRTMLARAPARSVDLLCARGHKSPLADRSQKRRACASSTR